MFTITQINTTFPETSAAWTPIVFAYSEGHNDFEWGTFCSKKSLPVNYYGILSQHEISDKPFSYLQISTQRGQYQIYWMDGTEGNVVIILQELTTETPYPNNQSNLWTGKANGQSFQLNIDTTVTSGSGITLTEY